MTLNRRRIAIAAASVAAFVVVLIVGLWLGVPAALRWGIETVGSREVGRPMAVGEIHFNPFTLRLAIHDFSIDGAAGETKPLLTLGELHTQIGASSIFRLAPIVKSLRLQTLRAHVARVAPNRFNFSDIVERFNGGPSSDEPARFAIFNIELADGGITLDDQVVGKQHTVADMNFGIPFASSLPDDIEIKVQPSFSARFNQAQFKIDGETLPFADSLATSIALRFTGLHLPTYVGYVPAKLNFTVPSGELNTDLRITFRRAVAAQEQRPAQPARLLLTGRASIRDLALQPTDTSEPLLQWRTLETVLDEVAIFEGHAKVKSVALTAPALRVTRRDDGSMAGFSAFEIGDGKAARAPQADQAKDKSIEKAKPFRVDVAQIRVTDGNVSFGDESVDFKRQLQALTINVDSFSTASEAPAKFSVSASADDKSQLKLSGDVRVAPLQVTADAAVASMSLPDLAPYLRPLTHAAIDGTVDVAAQLRVNEADGQLAIAIADGRITADSLRVRGTGGNRALLLAPKIEVTGVHADLQQRAARIERVRSVGARVQAARKADGRIDWQALLVDAPPGKPAAPAADNASPWSVKVEQIELIAARAVATDEAVQPEVKLAVEAFNADVRNVGTDPRARMTVHVRTKIGGGTAQVRGWLRPLPLATELQLDLANIDITALRPYLAEHTSAVLASAAVWADGILTVDGAKDTPAVSYQGSARLTNFAALNPGGASELVRWQALALEQVRVDTSARPPAIEIGQIKLNDFYARAILSQQGQLNLVEAMRPPGAASAAATKAEATAKTDAAATVGSAAKPTSIPTAAKPPVQSTAPVTAPATALATTTAPEPAPAAASIRIGGIEVLRGNVNFTDNFIKPNYTANLTDLVGTVGALSSERAEMADVSLRGKVDGDAPLDITGKVNPLANPLALELRGSAKGVELPRLTPYSVKYAGYPITKGKLSMDVQYKIDGGKLQANNHLFLDQLTFGEHVDSPTATSLPVLLAVALLQNSRGEIDIELPVSGSLDDPQFSVGGIIVRVIINLITKAITAPFALLASAFGGGADLDHLEFAAGSALIAEAQLKKIETLSKALNDRPGLRLDITGRALAAADTEAMRRAKFDAKLRAAKLRELVRAGQSVDPATVTVAADEREKLIGRVYADEEIPDKPRNFLGFAKSIPPADMEKLIMATVTVNEADLRQLANERATAVRDRLSNQGKVPRERMFLIAPLLDGSGGAEKLPPTRVDFSLK